MVPSSPSRTDVRSSVNGFGGEDRPGRQGCRRLGRAILGVGRRQLDGQFVLAFEGDVVSVDLLQQERRDWQCRPWPRTWNRAAAILSRFRPLDGLVIRAFGVGLGAPPSAVSGFSWKWRRARAADRRLPHAVSVVCLSFSNQAIDHAAFVQELKEGTAQNHGLGATTDRGLSSRLPSARSESEIADRPHGRRMDPGRRPAEGSACRRPRPCRAGPGPITACSRTRGSGSFRALTNSSTGTPARCFLSSARALRANSRTPRRSASWTRPDAIFRRAAV